jgi:hypothetical protein
MYITKPPRALLNSFFMCGARLGERLEDLGLEAIYKDPPFYYFTKNEHLCQALSEVPFWIKWLERLPS